MADFFISYNKVDRSWAEWVAWQLEEANYSAIIQAWDFRPGCNFVLEMQKASAECDRTIAVLSSDYLAAQFTHPEWAAAFANDPQGLQRKLIPVRVGLCDPVGLLSQISYVDLIGLTEPQAKETLLTGVRRGRGKPSQAPTFPLARHHAVTTKPAFPTPAHKAMTNAVNVVRAGRFEASATSENNGNLLKYRIYEEGHELRYCDVMQLWRRDQEFLDFYISIFNRCGFQSYVWETPCVSKATIDRIFEFVLFNVPQGSRTPDRKAYASYFDTKTSEHGIVAFSNLGGDAVLIVPSPFRKDANYSDFAAFYREAPVRQQRALWKELARYIEMYLSDNPIWISVSSGISWLHLRLDSCPKYYRYSPYLSS